MVRKSITVGMLLLVSILALWSFKPVSAKSTEESLKETIEKTINRDKDKFEKLSPYLKKAYNKLVDAFKSLGKLSKDVSRIVKMYNDLDEDSEDYPEKLQEFFKEYNKLGVIKRKLVDFCTGLLNAKDKLIYSVKHMVNVDMYSTKVLKPDIAGPYTYSVENENIVTIDENGKISTVGMGFTKINVSNGTEEVTYRVFVKKTVLATKANVKLNNKIKITVANTYTINELRRSNDYINVTREGNYLYITGAKKGTSYLYVGTTDGKTLKYKITVK